VGSGAGPSIVPLVGHVDRAGINLSGHINYIAIAPLVRPFLWLLLYRLPTNSRNTTELWGDRQKVLILGEKVLDDDGKG
jgi:hypothetical protein